MPTTAYSRNSESGIYHREKFIELSTALSNMAKKENLSIAPFVSPELVYFSNLTEKEKNETLSQLESLVVICQQMQARGEKIRSVKSLTWAFLKHFQCTAPSDLINYLNEGDLVNAYGIGHKMLFASFTFFEVFTYSLEDFYCRPWMELFERDNPQAQEALFNLANEILDGQHDKVTPMTMIPDHRCSEISSPRRTSIWFMSQFCSPIFYKGEIIGYLGTHRYQPMASLEITPQLNATLA